MKNKKAPGPDGILAEYIKVFGDIAEPVLLKLINVIFVNNIYPTAWTTNFLKPIFKKGDVKDTHNYRGLAIGSAIAKLHSLILLRRLVTFVKTKNLISPNQTGFMEGCRTSDHIFLLQTIIEKIVKKNRKKLFCAFVDFKKAYDTVDRSILLQQLNKVGISGIFYKNIAAMNQRVEYSIKVQNGYIDPIRSKLGLKQGCPLSPILFNLYIDGVKNIFDQSCEPIEIRDRYVNHFMYADDLVLLSNSKTGLQNCLLKLQAFSIEKHLTISVDKTKVMIFNHSGRLYKQDFFVDNQKLEVVNNFCYLGFDVKASGVVSAARETLYSKAKKAMRPLKGAIARFDIPVKTSIKLFHSYIEPILLYTCENWMALSDKNVRNFTNNTVLDGILTNKVDILHRQFLKYIIGTSKSCPNLAVYGDTGEQPLSLKAYKLMLKFWYRVKNLPNASLVKVALLENTDLRTNWIKTVEKIAASLELTEVIDNPQKFNKTLERNLKDRFIAYWRENLRNPGPRLEFYARIKLNVAFESYLNLTDFNIRKGIAKLRCSDHALEIEKGRHNKNDDRDEDLRLCPICPENTLLLFRRETEEHFLIECTMYKDIRAKYGITSFENDVDIMNNIEPEILGKYIFEAWSERTLIINLNSNVQH